MDVFLSHIWYIFGTFAAGLFTGWATYKQIFSERKAEKLERASDSREEQSE
jgi:hypothetical protein